MPLLKKKLNFIIYYYYYSQWSIFNEARPAKMNDKTKKIFIINKTLYIHTPKDKGFWRSSFILIINFIICGRHYQWFMDWLFQLMTWLNLVVIIYIFMVRKKLVPNSISCKRNFVSISSIKIQIFNSENCLKFVENV